MKGYEQQQNINYFEIFPLIVRFEIVYVVLAFAVQMELQVFQFDVKIVFFNDYLNKDVYIEQPQGFICEGRDNKVYN